MAISMRCPNCGGGDFREDQEYYICQYCDSKFPKSKGMPGDERRVSEELRKEYATLLTEIRELRSELTRLMFERDELRDKVCKDIEIRYMKELGELEAKVHRAEAAYYREKRRLELIQAKFNRQETVDDYEIDSLLDEELQNYQDELDEEADVLDFRVETGAGGFSEEEEDELKELYRFVVKLLHPDTHPNLTEQQKQLYQKVVEAYKKKELDKLRVISETLEDDTVLNQKMPIEEIRGERERLFRLVEQVRSEVQEIKSSYPYNVKDFIEDEMQVARKKKDLQEQLAAYKRETEEFRTRIRELLGR